MSGIPDYNFPLFFEVHIRLVEMGYGVENPAQNNGLTLSAAIKDARSETRSWADYMRLDLVRLARADAICLLPGWQNSRGALLEAQLAAALEMPLWHWVEGRLLTDVVIAATWGVAA